VEIDEERARRSTVESVIKSSPQFGALIASKTFVLMKAPPEDPLYTGDSPVTLHNSLHRSPHRSTLGLAVEGIEVNLPLSSTLSLAFWCPTLGEMLQEGYKTALANKWLHGKPLPGHESLELLAKGITEGSAVPLLPQVVEHLNSLQVAYSARHVYCHKWHFDLVKRMIRDNPKFREEIKPEIDP
jgi:hypothetical protein